MNGLSCFFWNNHRNSPFNKGKASSFISFSHLSLLTISGYMPRCLVQQTESKLWQVAGRNQQNYNTQRSGNNRPYWQYTRLKYFLCKTTRGASKHLIKLCKSNTDGAQEMFSQCTASLGLDISVCLCFSVSLTQVGLPALQGRLLQCGAGSRNVHVASVVAGQGNFKYVLQHLTFAVHQLCPHSVHRL